MVTCTKCGASVEEAKFCENCGASLSGTTNKSEVKGNVCPKCGAEVFGGKFCEKCGAPLSVVPTQTNSFFSKISDSMNKAATDMLAIKSDFSNGNIIYMVSKIPNVQKKKIRINPGEFVYYNNGSGYVKREDTFTTTDTSFKCFYLKNENIIQNSIDIPLECNVMKIESEEKINIDVRYDFAFEVSNIEEFFNKLVNIKLDTWKTIDINSMLADKVSQIIIEKTTSMLKENGNLDLRDPKNQIEGFSSVIVDLITAKINEYGLSVNFFNVSNVSYDVYKINQVLINNLYKKIS